MKISLLFYGVTALASLFRLEAADRSVLTTERLYLSGLDSAEAVPWEFRCSSGANAGEWSTLPVPSNWEMHGFGTLSYHSLTPSERGEYRRRFHVPVAWEGRRIRIVFDGVMTDARVVVNGRAAGPLHQGGFYRFSHDITALVNLDGENLLEVFVDETSANEGVNRAERTGDYWNFGGIFRPVWLEAAPLPAIERVAIDARADGRVSIDVFTEAGAAASAEARIVNAAGEVVSTLRAAFVGGAERTRVAGRIDQPALWTAETPNLYRAQTRLLDANGRALHEVETRFGFRTFEIRRGDGFYLNGRRIVLQGANRHSFNARTGRALAEADHREDIRLMKEMNATAVRMSHYPPDERFLELCDEEGLYVLDELAGWQKSYDTPVGRALLEAMVKRDVNHPSILLWDNGNEGGWNTELDQEFSKWDPQNRPVLHPWQIFSGVNTAHYRLYPQLPALTAGLETAWRYDPNDVPKQHEQPLIYLPTEFLHGLYDGGAGAGMEDTWSLMRRGKYFGGGFVWAWMDEGVLLPGSDRVDVRGNLAPDGILGPRREKEASFFTLKELWSPVVVQERALGEEFRGLLSLENRYSFTNTASCRFGWELRRLPMPGNVDSPREPVVLNRGEARTEIAPGSTGPLQLELPESWREADVLALRIDDPNGRELWTYTWPLPGIARMARVPHSASALDAGNVNEVAETSGVLVLTSGSTSARFDRATGELLELGRGERRLALAGALRSLSGPSTLTQWETRKDGSEVVVKCGYSGGLRSVEWRVRANGWIDCSYAYAGTAGSTFQGVGFHLPGTTVRAKRWVGDGPYRVWQNRRRGGALGVWANDYNDTVTGWSGYTYPEFKGFFSGVRWLALQTSEGSLTVVPRTEGLFVQVMKPGLPPAELQAKTAMMLPDADVGLLHVIPAIGTKFSRPEDMGPQSQTPVAQPEYRGAFSLRWD